MHRERAEGRSGQRKKKKSRGRGREVIERRKKRKVKRQPCKDDGVVNEEPSTRIPGQSKAKLLDTRS
jgi:hypothetical protein